MRLILSRKGFDSSSAFGGCASPILPDGQMISLPIPHSEARVAYSGVQPRGLDIAHIVADLTRGRVTGDALAHLDPDLERTARSRQPGWTPAFGQVSAAQSHLENNGVGTDDLFLFFGWFREVEFMHGHYRYRRNAPDLHVLFGWLRVGQVLRLGPDPIPDWLRDHPHAVRDCWPQNTVYVAKDPEGGGVVSTFDAKLVLTEPGRSRSVWLLPADFMPRSRPPLTYHRSQWRWTKTKEGCRLQSVSKGQEFVLDLGPYPEVHRWAEATVLGAA
jgi:hypothetical protein